MFIPLVHRYTILSIIYTAVLLKSITMFSSILQNVGKYIANIFSEQPILYVGNIYYFLRWIK